MKLYCLQHAEFDGPAFLPQWAAKTDHTLSTVLVHAGQRLPLVSDFDGLIVMGGPMSLRDEPIYPWIADERRLIEQALLADKPVFGICLGAQLLAEVLGAPVTAGAHPEIGWFPVQTTTAARDSWPGECLPPQFETFFWHQDTFGIPQGATRIARTDAYENQGFVWERHIGLQFHLEVTPEWAAMLVARDAEQLADHRFICSADRILAQAHHQYRQNNAIMASILERWTTIGSRHDRQT